MARIVVSMEAHRQGMQLFFSKCGYFLLSLTKMNFKNLFFYSLPDLIGHIFVSPVTWTLFRNSLELCSERDYMITHCVCSMYVVCGNLGKSFAKLITVSTYFDVFPWDLDTMIQSHTCDLNRCGVKGHLGVNDLWFKFLKKGHCIHIL